MTEQTATQEPGELAPQTPATENRETLATSEEAAQQQESAPAISEKAQETINRNVRAKHDALRETERLRQELDQLRQQQPQQQTQGEPTLEQFDFDETKFNAALIDHRVGQRFQEFQTQQNQQQALQAQQAAQSDYSTRANAFATDNPGFAESVGSMPMQNQAASQAIMKTENGPAIAFHLSKNLDLVDKLNSMDPVSAAMEIGILSARLQTTKPKTTTAAPKPLEPVSGNSSLGSKKVQDMTVAELIQQDEEKKRSQGA